MQLVERHVSKKGHLHYQEIDKLCFAPQNLDNAANYLIRQSFIQEQVYLNFSNGIEDVVVHPVRLTPAK